MKFGTDGSNPSKKLMKTNAAVHKKKKKQQQSAMKKSRKRKLPADEAEEDEQQHAALLMSFSNSSRKKRKHSFQTTMQQKKKETIESNKALLQSTVATSGVTATIDVTAATPVAAVRSRVIRDTATTVIKAALSSTFLSKEEAQAIFNPCTRVVLLKEEVRTTAVVVVVRKVKVKKKSNASISILT
jgi:hypothetical protein